MPENVLYAIAGAAVVWAIRIGGGWLHSRIRTARLARRGQRLAREFDSRRFSIGGFDTSMFVADLHIQGYLPSLLRSEVSGPLELDEAVLEAGFERRQSEWAERAMQRLVYGGSVLALRQYRVFRTAETEQPGLWLQFAETDYLTQRAVGDCFRDLPEEHRDSVALSAASGGPDAGSFSATFGTQIAVITADDQLMWLRRSMNTAVNAGRFTCTTAEGMNRDDVRSGQPDPYLCAARGLHEEVGVRLATDEMGHIRLTALALNLEWWEWGLLGVIDFRALGGQRLDSSALADYFTSAQAKDKWETSEPTFVPFRPRDVARFIASHDVTNYGAVSAIFALLGDPRFTKGEVAAAFEALRRPFRSRSERARSV